MTLGRDWGCVQEMPFCVAAAAVTDLFEVIRVLEDAPRLAKPPIRQAVKTSATRPRLRAPASHPVTAPPFVKFSSE